MVKTMLPRPTVSDAHHFIFGLSPSCARKRACMELTTIRRFQRLYKSLLLYQMDDVQRATSILGGREVSRPYQDGLSINEFCGFC